MSYGTEAFVVYVAYYPLFLFFFFVILLCSPVFFPVFALSMLYSLVVSVLCVYHLLFDYCK